MARSEIMQKIADLSEERERLLAREGSHHAGVGDHRRLADIDHALGVLWDLRRRELAGENVRLDEDFLDRYVVSPGDDAPGGGTAGTDGSVPCQEQAATWSTPLAQVRQLRPRSIGRTYTTSTAALEYEPES